MAKRMTDTDKWKKPFIKSLPTEIKLFWFYILDDCDHAGIWHVDMEVCNIRLGFELDTKYALNFLGNKIIVFDNGTKWFIPDFIIFQYGDLTPSNKMYKPVSTQLNRYNLMGHISPINGVKVQVQDKVKDKEEVKEQEPLQKFSIEHCIRIALLDSTWVQNVRPTTDQLNDFTKHLIGTADTEKTPIDFKSHFYNWRNKQKPEEGKLVIKPLKSRNSD